ncbi:MAG: CDP-glycerol glycerophosphotransferase family protein [bacterium]
MKLLFYIAKQYSVPIILPLTRFCRYRNIEYALFISQKVNDILPDEWENDSIFFDRKSATAFLPDFVLCPGNFVDFRLPGIKVQLFHGLGIEKESHYKIRHFFDIYCTSGPFVTERFKILQTKYKYFHIEETGWPKIDYILNYDSTDLKKKYAIPDDKTIILYAPTFSEKMESASELIPHLKNTIRGNEYWILKFHELMDKNIIAQIDEIDANNIKIIETYDVTPLLHLADVMISDTSSVIYEFMVLNKPVVTYKTQSRIDKAINITDPGELRAAIDKALSESCTDRNNKQLSEINPYLDGRISENLINRLEEIHKHPENLPNHKKPLNLYRKIQIMYHERFRKGYLR